MFKKLMVVAGLVLATSAFADMEKHEYIASVTGKFDCTMPADIDHPMNGDCVLTKAYYETGTKVERQGGTCLQTTVTLANIESIRFNEFVETKVPSLKTKNSIVPCSDELWHSK